MRVDIITIFPDYFSPLRLSLLGKAAERGIIEFAVHDLRQWAHDRHRTVDDTPFGGGPGMVMLPEPWGEALDAVAGSLAAGRMADAGGGPAAGPGGGAAAGPGGGAAAGPGVRLIVPTPSGVPFRQQAAAGYARCDHLIFACGRYEGIDARVIEDARTRMNVDEVSIGDYVLAGGEPAALVMIEAIARLLPGVLGNEGSVADDSFGGGGGPMDGLLEGPVYTRPRTWRGHEVPAVLLSGDHGAIARWRRDEALRRTAATRPDLIAALPSEALGKRDRQVLADAGPGSGAAADSGCPERSERMAD